MREVTAGGSNGLPAVVNLHHPEAWDVWILYRAFDRRFLPSQIMAEPKSWLDDMLELDSLYNAMEDLKKAD